MCGIAGIIHRGETGCIGEEITAMLHAMKHRGPDSTGFAFYGAAVEGELVLRLIVVEQEKLAEGFEIHEQIKLRKAEIEKRISSLGGEIVSTEEAREYACMYRVRYGGELRRFADYIEDIEGVKILSIGSRLELIKDLGDARSVSAEYGLGWIFRLACHRACANGDRIGCRYSLRPSLLGLSIQRHLGGPQRPVDQLLE